MTSAGLDPGAPVRTLFARVDALSPGSVLLYAVVGKTLREAPIIAALRQSMAEQGSPWLFGTDAPGARSRISGGPAA